MTLNDVLLHILDGMSATGDSYIVSWDSTQQWPANALNALQENGILSATTRAESIECKGCCKRCFMDVQKVPSKDKKPARAFVVCDDPEMQDQMGIIKVAPERLQQWKVTALSLANVVAGLLAIESKAEDRHGHANIRIGMIKGKSGRRWLSLNKSPLALETNDHQLPLAEVLFFENDTLTIDRNQIMSLGDTGRGNRAKKYTPSIDKRENRKRKTEAMYQDWREAYLKLRQEHPDTARHSDNWIAKKIAKMDIAQGRDSETIRKNMQS